MKTNPSKAELDQENYRVDHGAISLAAFLNYATSQLVVVKHHDAEKVQVVEVDSLSERFIEPGEFKAGFGLFLLDEMALYSGNPEAISSATPLFESVDAAIKHCLYGATQEPILADARS